MSSSLLVTVKEAKFDSPLPENTNIYVSVKANGVAKKSSAVKAHKPVWNNTLEYSFKYPLKSLNYELRQQGVFCDSTLGSGCIPITQIFASCIEGDGEWYPLYTWAENEWKDTGQKVLLDCRFALPPDLTAEEEICLEMKLSTCKETLREELQVITDQSEKIREEGFQIDTKRHFRRNFSLENVLTDTADEKHSKSFGERYDTQGMEMSVIEVLGSNHNSDTEVDKNIKSGSNFQSHKGAWCFADADANFDCTNSTKEALPLSECESFLVPNTISTPGRKKKFPRVALRRKIPHLLLDSDASNTRPRLRSIFEAVHKTEIKEKTKSTIMSFQDEILKDQVYQKALQALIYPITLVSAHTFEIFSAQHPVYCDECEGLLYGLAKQGLRCVDCGTMSHEKCKDLIDADCLQRKLAKSLKSTNQGTEEILKVKQAYINSTIEKRLIENYDIFDMLKSAFDIDEHSHGEYLEAATKHVLHGSSKWSAKIAVTVVSARDLTAKDDAGKSDPYVTIQVGRVKKRTKTIHDSLNPTWNETFEFECKKPSEPIKLRVWDEDKDLRAKLRKKLNQERDEFLGQIIIDVSKLSCSIDDWYILEKRTEKSIVSGSIRLLIRIDIEGEETGVPYIKQYSLLHKKLYQYMHGQRSLNAPGDVGSDLWTTYLDQPGQEILDEFSGRYNIETIYQAMTHFSCLAKRFNEDGYPRLINTMLANISCHFSQLASESTSSFQQHLAATHFGKEQFEEILNQLYEQTNTCISNYRSSFPTSDPSGLSNLKATIDLLKNIVLFRNKLFEDKSPQQPVDVVKQLISNCLDSNFKLMLDNCVQTAEISEDQGDINQDIVYWLELIQLVTELIEDDKTVYSNYFSQFPSEIDLGQLSATKLWHSLITKIKGFLLKQESCSNRTSTAEYMKLFHKMNVLFNKHVANYQSVEAEYNTIFEPLIADWLKETDKKWMEFLSAAIHIDDKNTFKPVTEDSRHSESVVDMFCFIMETIDIILKFQIPDKQLELKIINSYSLMVKKVLTQYCKSVVLIFKKIFKTAAKNSIVIINNIHNCNVQLECLYKKIGVEKMTVDTETIFRELQTSLSKHVSEFCEEYGNSLSVMISSSCKKVGLNLLKITNLNTSASNYIDLLEKQASDLMDPILEFLKGNFLPYYRICEPIVLDGLLKVLWKIILKSIREEVLLPVKSRKTREKYDKNLYPSQCAALKEMLEILQSYFHDQGNGVAISFFENDKDLTELQYIIDLYNSTSYTLIKDYISISSGQQNDILEGDIVGKVNINVDVFTYGLTGENKITVKVIELKHLIWPLSATFLPYVQVCFLGPQLSERGWKSCTKSRSNDNCPTYNETFEFYLNSDECLSNYELQISAKDYCFAREDKLIGTVTLPFREIMHTNSKSHSICLNLARSVSVSDIGRVILQILSHRKNDDTAKEFAMLKLEQRME